MRFLRKFVAALALAFATQTPRNDGKPDDRVFGSFSGVIHSQPDNFPVALIVLGGPTYQLDFTERPDLLPVARQINQKAAVVSGLYGESFVDMPGFRSTTKTIRVFALFETKEEKK